MENVYLVGCKPYDFQGYKGFTLAFLYNGASFKISSKMDLSSLLEKNAGAPVKGDLEFATIVAAGKLKPQFVSFSPKR